MKIDKTFEDFREDVDKKTAKILNILSGTDISSCMSIIHSCRYMLINSLFESLGSDFESKINIIKIDREFSNDFFNDFEKQIRQDVN